MNSGTGHSPVTHSPAAPDPEEPNPPGKKWTLAVGGLIAVFVLLAAYAVISGVGVSKAGTSPGARTESPSAVRRSSPTPNPPRTSASSPAQHALSIAAITAFGPAGTSDGDNPGLASRVIEGGSQPWYSSWYASAEFGNLQAGTGLLLDMGQAVRISAVRVVLGSLPGATFRVLVGDTAALPDLSTVATATNVAGTVQLPVTTQDSSRYVLIWFTQLPPNGQGKYQIDVYSVTVDGAAGA